jgi:hypothetical protein
MNLVKKSGFLKSNFVKPTKIGGEVDHNAAAFTEKTKGAIR